MGILILLPILLPIIAGTVMQFKHFNSKNRKLFVSTVTLVNSLIIALLIFSKNTETFTILKFTSTLSFGFKIDGLSIVFASLLAVLWPIATFYAFEYMEHEGEENKFFKFFTITYGVTVAIAFSSNVLTMYLFYELLTLSTIPLIMHKKNNVAISAGRKYIIYSIAGAALAFMGAVIIYSSTNSLDFVYDGLLSNNLTDKNLLITGFLMMFLGFGVKAAIFPFHGWLPTAGVAPTPVTGLLHAVAVVKSGIFAIIRVIYYLFGTNFLVNTWGQTVTQIIAISTIVFGSAMAIRETNLKRRLAYSTISNLSYILFGITLMTHDGFQAGILHMLFHGIMKICLFFCAGAYIVNAHKEDINDLKGIGKVMPITTFAFTVGSLALVGLPGLCGFISKFSLATAAITANNLTGVIGIFALVFSAFLTAIYLFTVIVKIYWTGKNFNIKTLKNIKETGSNIKVSLIVLCCLMLILGLFSDPLSSFVKQVALGLI